MKNSLIFLKNDLLIHNFQIIIESHLSCTSANKLPRESNINNQPSEVLIQLSISIHSYNNEITMMKKIQVKYVSSRN